MAMKGGQTSMAFAMEGETGNKVKQSVRDCASGKSVRVVLRQMKMQHEARLDLVKKSEFAMAGINRKGAKIASNGQFCSNDFQKMRKSLTKGRQSVIFASFPTEQTERAFSRLASCLSRRGVAGSSVPSVRQLGQGRIITDLRGFR